MESLPRYRRVAGSAPPMLLTGRDLALLEDVWRYRLLTTSQIETLRFNDPDIENRFVSRLTLTRRLKLLFHHRYLRRISRPLSQGSREPVYVLDSEGARVLSQKHGEVAAPPPSRLPAAAALDHLLAIGQMRLSLAVANPPINSSAKDYEFKEYSLLEWLAGSKVRFRVVLEETGRRKQAVSIVPDGCALVRQSGLEPNGFVRHYAFIEVDRGTEPQRTIAAKCRAYLAYWQSGGFARDFSVPVGLGFRVLFVAPTGKRQRTIEKAIAGALAPHQLFRVALEEDITPQRVLQAVWQDVDSGQKVPPF